MVSDELEQAVAEHARRLRQDLAAGFSAALRERAIEQYVYNVVNLHLQVMLAGPLPPQDEIERRFEAALAHAAEAAGLPPDTVDRFRARATEHWRMAATQARLHETFRQIHAGVERLTGAIRLSLPPLWGLPAGVGARPGGDAATRQESGPPAHTSRQSELPAAEAPPALQPPRGTAEPIAPQPGKSRAARPQPAFPNRARWLREELKRRGLSKRALSDRRNGPDAKTVNKILEGREVREDALERLAAALRIPVDKIPSD